MWDLVYSASGRPTFSPRSLLDRFLSCRSDLPTFRLPLFGRFGGRFVGGLASETENALPVALPAPDEAVSFAKHIKPLFRKLDRGSMTFAFDMWSQHDVAEHAAAILQRLEAGTMPCDGGWPREKIALFRRWMESETAE